MSFLRSLSASLLSAGFSFALVTAGCSTNAVGIDDCREIEEARCKAGKPCGLIDDVDACQRYYRDHCLHGVSGKDPSGSQVSACVKVIDAAGKCAAHDKDIELTSCEPFVTESHPDIDLTKACEVVEFPERADECSFLLNEPLEGAGGAGGDAPTGSAGQGSGGAPTD
jgi:hypothetical protein